MVDSQAYVPLPPTGDSSRIVIAEDDPDDRLLTRRALEKSNITCELHTVENGEELMRFLRQCGTAEGEYETLPDLILLDLNMPRMDGREVLRTLKSDATLRRIPVVVFTTSEANNDILESYDLGVNAFVTKPLTFEGLVDAIQQLGRFWFDTVKLPK